MNKIIVLLLVLLTLLPCSATEIDIKEKGRGNHEGMHMPSITRVKADLDEELTVSVKNYTGIVMVYIYDVNGAMVDSNTLIVKDDGVIVTNVDTLPEGEYGLLIVLSGITYYGTFFI